MPRKQTKDEIEAELDQAHVRRLMGVGNGIFAQLSATYPPHDAVVVAATALAAVMGNHVNPERIEEAFEDVFTQIRRAATEVIRNRAEINILAGLNSDGSVRH